MRGCLAFGLWCLSLIAHADTVLVIGDSISAAYGIDKAQGWVSLLDHKLSTQCPGITVKNASVSGETSAGGVVRLPALLQQSSAVLVVIELGGNDGLRGLSPKIMQANLESMITQSQQSGAQVVVLGMRMPANLGEAFRALFDQAYVRAAETHQVPLLPFFLERIYDQPSLMQDDGIHPSAEAQPLLLDNAMQVIAPALAKTCPQLNKAS